MLVSSTSTVSVRYGSVIIMTIVILFGVDRREKMSVKAIAKKTFKVMN